MSVISWLVNWISADNRTPHQIDNLPVLERMDDAVVLWWTPETFAAIRLLIKNQQVVMNSLLIKSGPNTDNEITIDKKWLTIAPPLWPLHGIKKKKRKEIVAKNEISFALTYLKSLIRATYEWKSNVVVHVSYKTYMKLSQLSHESIKTTISKSLKDKFVDN